MKYRSVGFIILCGLFLLSDRAAGQKPAAPVKKQALERITQGELNKVAAKLAATEMRQYTHRIFSFDAAHTAKLDKETTVSGLFLMRDPAFMKKLRNGFFDDKQGNLIYLGHFQDSRKKDVAYAVTFAASGDVVLAFDVGKDGLADGIFGKGAGGALWSVVDNKTLSALRECFEEQALVPRCLGGRGSAGPGGGGNPSPGGGKSGGDSDLEEFLEDMADPDCDDTGIPQNPAMDGPEEKEIASLEKQKYIALDRAREERRAGHEAAARELERAARYAQSAINEFNRSMNEGLSASERVNARERYESSVKSYNEALDATIRAGGDTGALEYRDILPQPTPTMIHSYRRRHSSKARRPATPQGPSEGEDPRCAGRRAEIKQGLWFMDRKFCPDGDFLGCWERSTDAIRDFTQGRCRTEAGPAGGKVVVCERSKPEDPLDLSPPETPPSPVDGPARFRVVTGPRLNYTFLETTPLGAVLTIRCQQAGCPGAPQISDEMPKKH